MTNPTCGARTRSGGPCSQPLGWGTEHVGIGRCKLHGGNAGAPVRTGRYSIGNQMLAAGTARMLADPEPGNLLGELAYLRALAEDLGGRYTGEIDDGATVATVVERVVKVADLIHRIETRNTLTRREAATLVARMADIIQRYIPEPHDRARAVSELAGVLGLDQGALESGQAV